MNDFCSDPEAAMTTCDGNGHEAILATLGFVNPHIPYE